MPRRVRNKERGVYVDLQHIPKVRSTTLPPKPQTATSLFNRPHYSPLDKDTTVAPSQTQLIYMLRVELGGDAWLTLNQKS